MKYSLKLILLVCINLINLNIRPASIEPPSINDQLFKAVETDNNKLLKKLIEKKADIETCDKYGHTLLHQAIIFENGDAIKFLIENQANVQAKNRWGTTLLEIANWLGALCQTLKAIKSMDSRDFININPRNENLNELEYYTECVNFNMSKEQRRRLINPLSTFTEFRVPYLAISQLINNCVENRELLKKLTQEKLDNIFHDVISKIITSYGYIGKEASQSNNLTKFTNLLKLNKKI